MDQQKDVFSSDTSGGTPGTKTTRRGTSASVRSPSQSQATRVSPGKRAGSMVSPTLEYTRQMASDAQAHRTAVRLSELKAQAKSRDDAVGSDSQNEMFEGEFDLVPGTVARRNITVRRSRDRLSSRPVIESRTPEDLLQRRSNRRSIDVEYANEQTESRSASAKFHIKKHGEELKGPYRVIPYSQYDPDEGWRSAGISDRSTPITRVAHPKSKSLTKEERKTMPTLMSLGEVALPRDRVSAGHSSVFLAEETDSGRLPKRDDPFSDSTEENDLPIFLRRDIPSASEDSTAHGVLMELWNKRQRTSLDLVQALNDDDSDLFENIEHQMRQLNQQMHEVLKSHKTKDDGKFVGVDDLPLNETLMEELPLSDARPAVGDHPPALRQSSKSTDMGEFHIRLGYQGSQIIRRVHARTPNRVVYHLGQQFLREAFALPITNLSCLLLIHNHALLAIDGHLEDHPVMNGAEIMIIYVPQPFENPRGNEQFSSSSPNSGSHNLPAAGDHAGHHREEGHSYNNARAPSQPGTNGGANTYDGNNSAGDRMAEECHEGERETRTDLAYRVPSSTNVSNSLPESHHDFLSRNLNPNAPFLREDLRVADSGQRRTDYGNHRGEINELGLARVSSHNGNNDRGYQQKEHGEYHRDAELRMLYDVRTPQPIYSYGATYPVASEGRWNNQFDVTQPISSGSYDKIRQAFKCPRFSGQAREWKQWNKGFLRYLSIWDLDYVLDPSFLDDFPLTVVKIRDNKMVYYIIEDAVQNSATAAAYVRQAPLNNGFEAYYNLHDGFVFAGSTTATLLLNELSNFRFLPNETPTALCFRLGELFEELSLLPGNASVVFSDT